MTFSEITNQIQEAVKSLATRYGIEKDQIVIVLSVEVYLILNHGLKEVDKFFYTHGLTTHFDGMDILIDHGAPPHQVKLLCKNSELALALARDNPFPPSPSHPLSG